MVLPSRLSPLLSTLVSTSAANSHGTNTLIPQQRKHLRPSTSSEEISRAAQSISVSSVTKHSAWSESMTWLMTSSWYRGHRVLSRLMFWRSYNEFADVTKKSNVYRLWGISPVRGAFVPYPTTHLVDIVNLHLMP